MAKHPVLNAYLEDGDDQIVIVEQIDGVARERRIRASYTTWHRAEDLDPKLTRLLKNSEHVRSFTTTEDGWVLIGWRDDYARRQARYSFKDEGIACYEGDVEPVMFWLVQTNAQIAKPRRCSLDFETDSRVPPSRKQDMRVLSWAVTDFQTGKTARAVLAEDTEEAEAELLRALVQELSNFDLVTVWEGDWKGGEFDTLIFEARTRRCGLGVDPRRWIWLNQLAVWKRMNAHSAESGAEKESFKLEDIAFEQLGVGKEKAPDWVIERFGETAKRSLGALAWELWEAGGKFRELLLEYNARDAELLYLLEKKKGYLTLFQATCEICGIPPVTQSLQPTRQMDGYLLRLGRTRNHRFPTKAFRDDNEEEEKKGKFKGAVVFHPKSVPDEADGWSKEHAAKWRAEHNFKNGILRDVHVCDFKSLYPSVMRSYNLSADAVAGWMSDREYAEKGVPPGMCRSPGTGLLTRTDPEGFLPLALRALMNERQKYADAAALLPPGSPEWHDMMSKSTACKVTANSFYGGGGSKYSRFNHRDVSEACTQNGVHFLKLTASEGEKRKMVLVYGDSLTPERTVVVRSPEGDVTIVPIGRFWEMVRSRGPVRESHDKSFAAAEGWQALTEKGWRPIKAVIQHYVKKSVHAITTKHGQVRVTADHSLVCGGKEKTPAEFVSEGLRFDVVDAPLEPALERIDLLQYLREARFRFERRGKVYVRKFVASSDGKSILLDNGEAGESIRIRRYYEANSNAYASLLRLVGAYVSDGSASIRGKTAIRSLLSFCKSNPDHMREIASDLRSIFEGGQVFGPDWSETVFVVRSGAHAMACLFEALCGAGSKNKRLPPFVYALTQTGFEILYKAFEDGDGHVEASGALRFTMTSQELAAGVSYVLSQRRVAHSFAYRESKGAWILRTRKGKERTGCYTIKHRVDVDYEGMVYDLSVEDAHTFVDGIGRVLLHNTDSNMVIGPTELGFRSFVKWINTKKIPVEVASHGCKENFVELAFEKTFERIVFVSAKAYVGRYSQYKGTPAKRECHGADFKHGERCKVCGGHGKLAGEPEIKGVAWKRGDKGKLTRELQGKIIDLLVGGVKLKDASGKKVPANPGIETPTEDLDLYLKVLEAARTHVLSDPLPLTEVRLSKSLSKSLREYGKDAGEAHVRVARELEGRGQSMTKGMRVEYVVVDGEKSPQLVIPAEDYTGDCDRFYLWERVYEPSKSLLVSAFPDYDWEQWGNVRPPKPRGRVAKVPEAQLGLVFDARASTLANDFSELAVPGFSMQPLIVRVPESAGGEALERVKGVLIAHPGARKAELRIVLKSGGEVGVPATLMVSTGPKLKAAIEEALAIAT